MSDASAHEYVLGTQDEEIQRLGLQAQLWRGQACAIWERARFGLGNALLDVGCGPGFGTTDLSSLVGERGRVVAVDESQKFLDRVKSLRLTNVEARLSDVQQLDLSAESFDGAYARWVLCFVREPQRVVDAVARALKPGGRFAIQDYYNYTAIKLGPRSEAFERVIAAVAKSWREHGGDPDVAMRLPALLDRAGLRVSQIQPLVRAARPVDSLWHWPTTFFKIFVPTLVKSGFLKESDREEFDRDWTARTNDPNALFVSPPMMDIVAEKQGQ